MQPITLTVIPQQMSRFLNVDPEVSKCPPWALCRLQHQVRPLMRCDGLCNNMRQPHPNSPGIPPQSRDCPSVLWVHLPHLNSSSGKSICCCIPHKVLVADAAPKDVGITYVALNLEEVDLEIFLKSE